jgi:phospholipid/cholesterol/gamma-HCH transport system permease protein
MKKAQVIAVTSQDGARLCVALGVARLDIDTAPRAFRELDALLQGKVKECRLDLSVVTEFTPAGISLFPALAERCAERSIVVEWEHVPAALDVALKRQEGLRNSPRPSAHSIFDVAASLGYIGGLSMDLGRLTRETVAFLGELAAAMWQAITAPHRIRWRETFYYMDVCGSDALPISALICFLMGLILGVQGALQLQKYGADIFLADGVGLSIVKELGPLMVAMICTGRAGSAFAAEIGTMKVGEEIDALTTMGLVPSRFLVVPKLIAMVVVMPLLTLFGDVVGIIGGMTVAYVKLDIPIISYINRTLLVITPAHLAESIVKSLAFAVIITVVGCLRGFQAKNDAQGVGRAATSAVVTSIFLIIIADTIITFLFNDLVYR